eukprot:s4572_g4.t1
MAGVQSYVCAGWDISTALGGLTLAQLRACFSERLLKKVLTIEETQIKPWLRSKKKFSVVKSILTDPLPGTVPKKIGKFVYLPKKRLRGKTSHDSQASSSMPAAAAVSLLEACAADAEAELLAREDVGRVVEEDFGAHEEAAMAMHS